MGFPTKSAGGGKAPPFGKKGASMSKGGKKSAYGRSMSKGKR